MHVRITTATNQLQVKADLFEARHQCQQ